MKQDRPSATAAVVLEAVLLAAHDPAHAGLIDDDTRRWSEAIAREVLRSPRLSLFAVRNGATRWLLRRIEAAVAPGFVLHVAARKVFLGELATRAIEAGASQLIVIGAGYDVLGWRIAARHAGLPCFEVDHPGTQARKRAAMDSAGAPPQLFLVPADLSVQSIGEVLAFHPRFDARARTLVVIEGVLMYLPAEAVQALLSELTRLLRGGVTCLFTFMDRHADGSIRFATSHPLMNRWLRRRGEPFLWGLQRERLPAFLQAVGFAHVTTYGRAELTAACFPRSPPTLPLAEGEFIAAAST